MTGPASTIGHRGVLLRLVSLGALLGAGATLALAQAPKQATGSPWTILSGESGSDDWREARAVVQAAEAQPLMEALARRGRDPQGAARAAYWLGLFHYGSGDPATAATYFELAAAGSDPEVARQAGIWTGQCRQLAGKAAHAEGPVVGELDDLFEVREAMMRGDSLVRAGRPLDALRAYLALEGEARRLACLSLLYYRLGLIVGAASASGGGRNGLLDWETLATWEPAVATSPERALVAQLRRAPGKAAQNRGSETPFAEPVVDGRPSAVSPQGPGEFPDSLFPFEEQAYGSGTPESGETLAGAGTSGAPETASGARSEDSLRPQGSLIYVLQLGAFRDRDRARRAMERFTVLGLSVRLEEQTDAKGERLHLIWLGRCESREEAHALAERVLDGIDYEVVMGRP
jgi:cell division septation protein DedD